MEFIICKHFLEILTKLENEAKGGDYKIALGEAIKSVRSIMRFM